MKILLFVVFSLFLALVCGVFVPPRHAVQRKQQLLGEKECTYGPAYWCEKLTNAADCRATKHCIQTVWIHKQYPEDHTSICDTCKEMVKQARDQLESNETQELIKEVFEGSCALLRLKPVVEECDKLADDYIPDLIDTLASQMNPQVVCAVAGLCNNAKFQKLLAEQGEQVVSIKPSEVSTRNRCDDCNTVLDIVVSKFNSASRDDFLEGLLEFCGKMGSFSDSCSNVVIKYFSDIYSYIKANFNAEDFCLLSGECYANFHKHTVEITPMSKIGYVSVEKKDDLPCELCEQLVKHLREVLIANTTESEFKEVLEGICRQTKSFKDECLGIVSQYYDMIYQYLVDGLNANATCKMIKICPDNYQTRPIIAPLLPVDTAELAAKLNQEPEHVYIPKDDVVVRVMQPKQENPILSAQEMQLPIDLLVPPHQQVYNQESCIFCEYFLHYVQKAISEPKVEDEIKTVINKACSKLPRSVKETCIEFVNTYEPALVAILAQEIDPSQVCPMIRACPSERAQEFVDIFGNTKASSKCPLCLYAVTELEDMIKNDKTKSNIKAALQKVCNRLPGNLKPECTDFIDTYADELIEMLVADFKPQEVCVYLKLCTDEAPAVEVNIVEKEMIVGDIETNAIYDDTVDGHPVENLGDEKCILCEFIMKEIDDQLKDKKTDDDIKTIVRHVCNALPGTIKTDCNNFVDQYADAVIILLQEAMEPKSICAYMKLCKRQQHPLEFVQEEVSKCAVCRTAADIIKTILQNPKVDQNANHIFKKACRGMPVETRETDVALTDKTKNLKFGECIVCKLVVKAIQKIIYDQHVTIDQVKHIIKTICQGIPIWFRGPCDDFIREYFDKIAKLVINIADEGEICSTIMVCEANSLGFNESEQIEKNYVNVGTESCKPCKIAASVIKSVFQNPDLSNELRHGISQLCDLMPEPLKSVCSSELRTHWIDWVNFLGKFNAERFCRNTGLCSTWNEIENSIDNDGQESCGPCKIAASVMKSVFENAEMSNMLNRGIFQLCDLMPDPIKAVCHSELRTHWKDWLSLLRNFNAERFCRSTGLCSTWKKIENTGIKAGIMCDQCKMAANLVKTVIAISPTMPQTIRRMLVSKCQMMGPGVKMICNMAISRYWDKYVNLIRRYSADQFCNIVKLCSRRDPLDVVSTDSTIQKRQCWEVARVIKTAVEHPLVGVGLESMLRTYCQETLTGEQKISCLNNINEHSKTGVQYLIQKVRQFDEEQMCSGEENYSVELKKGTKRCFSCKLIIKSIRKVFKSEWSRDEVKKHLLDACNRLPVASSACHDLVERYSDKIIRMIGNHVDSEQICRSIGLCLKAELDYNENYTNEMTSNTYISNVGNKSQCLEVARIIKTAVEHPFAGVSVQNILTAHCEEKILEEKNSCLNLIKSHGQGGVDYLVNELRRFDEKEMCLSQDSDFMESDVKYMEYFSCKHISLFVGEVVKSEWTWDDVRRHLVEACDYVGIGATNCKSLIETYSDQIIRMIQNHVNLNEICRNIYVFENDELDYDNDIFLQILSSSNRETQIDTSNCALCLQYCSMIKENIKKSMERLSDLLDDVCHKFVEKYKKGCVDAMNQYLQNWMNNFNKINCQLYCEKTKRCP